jgi:hypothetical protein
MKSESGMTRRELLATAGVGMVSLVVPAAMSAAGAASQRRVVDLGGSRLADQALAAYRSNVLHSRGGEASGVLGSGLKLRVEGERGGVVSLFVSGRDGEIRIDSLPAANGVSEVVAHLEAIPGDHRGFDRLRVLPSGIELTYSDDLALRYATPEIVPGSRLPAAYDQLADRVLKDYRALSG